jgi:hypothetical protein
MGFGGLTEETVGGGQIGGGQGRPPSGPTLSICSAAPPVAGTMQSASAGVQDNNAFLAFL